MSEDGVDLTRGFSDGDYFFSSARNREFLH